MVSAPLNLIPTEKCCVTMVAKVLDLNKLWPTNMAVKLKKLTNDLAAFRNKTVAQSFLPSFNNKNGCLRQESLLRFDPEI